MVNEPRSIMQFCCTILHQEYFF